MMLQKVPLLLPVQPVRLEFHCSLVCVLNLQTLTQAICLVFSYLCLTGYSHSKVSFNVFGWQDRRNEHFWRKVMILGVVPLGNLLVGALRLTCVVRAPRTCQFSLVNKSFRRMATLMWCWIGTAIWHEGWSTVHSWMSYQLIVGSVPFSRCSGSFSLTPWFGPHQFLNQQPSTSKPSPQQTELPPFLRCSGFRSPKPEARRQYFCISVRAGAHACLVHRLEHGNLWHCMFVKCCTTGFICCLSGSYVHSCFPCSALVQRSLQKL